MSSSSAAALTRAVALALLGASAIVAAPRPASAKEPSAAELALAKDMLKEAIADEKDGKCADAIDILKQVIAIKEMADALLHLGTCQASTGQLTDALATLERAEIVAREAKDKATQQALVAALSSTRERVPMLEIKLPDGVAGAKVSLDGAEVAADKLAQPIAVSPGQHAIDASAAGRAKFSKKVDVAEKQRLEVAVELPALEAEPAGPAAPEGDTDAPSPGIPLATWIGASAAVVLTAGGFIAFAAAGGAASDGEAQCAKSTACDPGSIDSVHQLDTAALGMWIGAGIGAGVAITAYLLSRPGDPPPPAETGARLVVGPGSIGLAGRF